MAALAGHPGAALGAARLGFLTPANCLVCSGTSKTMAARAIEAAFYGVHIYGAGGASVTGASARQARARRLRQ